MYSAFYEYAYIKTASTEIVFSTKLAENFLLSQSLISAKGNGAFVSLNNAFNLQIVKANSFDSWNSNDYDSDEANYIALTIRKNKLSNFLGLITQLSKLLQLPFQLEEE